MPLVIGAGGGGLAHGPFKDDRSQHGNGTNSRLPSITAPSFGENPAGLYAKLFETVLLLISKVLVDKRSCIICLKKSDQHNLWSYYLNKKYFKIIFGLSVFCDQYFGQKK